MCQSFYFWFPTTSAYFIVCEVLKIEYRRFNRLFQNLILICTTDSPTDDRMYIWMCLYICIDKEHILGMNKTWKMKD